MSATRPSDRRDTRDDLPALPRELRACPRERGVAQDAPRQRFAGDMVHEETRAETVVRREDMQDCRRRHAGGIGGRHQCRLGLQTDLADDRRAERLAPQDQRAVDTRSRRVKRPGFLAGAARQPFDVGGFGRAGHDAAHEGRKRGCEFFPVISDARASRVGHGRRGWVAHRPDRIRAAPRSSCWRDRRLRTWSGSPSAFRAP